MQGEIPPEVKLFLGSLGLAAVMGLAWLVLKLLQWTEPRRAPGKARRSQGPQRPAQKLTEAELAALPPAERNRLIALTALDEAERLQGELERTQAELEAVKRGSVPPAEAPGAMGVVEWLTLTATEVDRAPHLFLIGATGSGKTTAAMAQLAARQGKKLIIDPKPPKPGKVKWGGLPYVMIDSDGGYSDIRAALKVANEEYKRRLAGLRNGTVAGEFEELTIFVDETPTVVSECPDVAAKLFKDIGRIGRELRIRLVLMSQTDRVKALGLEGEGDTRENFVFISLRLAGTKANPLYLAEMEWLGERYDLETRGLAEIGNGAVSEAVLWRRPGINLVKPGEPSRGDSLSSFFGDTAMSTGPISGAPEGAKVGAETPQGGREISGGAETSFPAQESDFIISAELFSGPEIAQITALILAGNGKTETIKAMPRYSGRKHAEYAAFYDKLYRLLKSQGALNAQ